MSLEGHGAMIIDEIERLFVAYDKGKEYLSSIFSRMDQQIEIWQKRRTLILDQEPSSSGMDFLLSKTQRINELTIDAIQNLCRVDLLIEQIIRIDPKIPTQTHPISTSFSSRSIGLAKSPSSTSSNRPSSHSSFPITSNAMKNQVSPQNETMTSSRSAGQPILPVLRKPPQQQLSSGRSSAAPSRENAVFKPIEQQYEPEQFETVRKPTLVQPRPSSYTTSEESTTLRSMSHPYNTRLSQGEQRSSPATTTFANEKVEVKLQRIPPGTKWKQAKIDVIDSLSAFYVENLDRKVHDALVRMSAALHDHYENLERANQLFPLRQLAIGDFGVARYSEDNRWYRARLLSCEENDQISIVFIDFGNMETKLTDEFFLLDRSFADLPAQAIACTLAEAYPRNWNEQESFWPKETIDIFKSEVTDKSVEIVFVENEGGAERWPLHFVKVMFNGQSVTNLPRLKQRIELKPNSFIAEQLEPSMTTQELMLFNVPMNET